MKSESWKLPCTTKCEVFNLKGARNQLQPLLGPCVKHTCWVASLHCYMKVILVPERDLCRCRDLPLKCLSCRIRTSCSHHLADSVIPCGYPVRSKKALLKEQISAQRCCKCRAVNVRCAGIPCTLMTLMMNMCHAWVNRNRSSSPEWVRLLQPLLPRPQKIQWPATYSRSQTPELCPDEKVVQDERPFNVHRRSSPPEVWDLLVSDASWYHHREAQNHSPEHSRSPFLAAGMIFPPLSRTLDPCQSSSKNWNSSLSTLLDFIVKK